MKGNPEMNIKGAASNEQSLVITAKINNKAPHMPAAYYEVITLDIIGCIQKTLKEQ